MPKRFVLCLKCPTRQGEPTETVMARSAATWRSRGARRFRSQRGCVVTPFLAMTTWLARSFLPKEQVELAGDITAVLNRLNTGWQHVSGCPE
jgi:hypothetical protein